LWTNLVDYDLNIVQCEWIDHELRTSQKACIIEKKSYYGRGFRQDETKRYQPAQNII